MFANKSLLALQPNNALRRVDVELVPSIEWARRRIGNSNNNNNNNNINNNYNNNERTKLLRLVADSVASSSKSSSTKASKQAIERFLHLSGSTTPRER